MPLSVYPCQATSQTTYTECSQLNMYLRIAVPKIVKKMKNNFDGTYFWKAAGNFIKGSIHENN